MRSFDRERRVKRRKLLQKAEDLHQGSIALKKARLKIGEETPGGLEESALKRSEDLRREAENLEEIIRLEEIKVYPHQKIKNGKTYSYWEAGWRGSNGKMVHVYLGSIKKVSEEEALEKARRLKAENMNIYESGCKPLNIKRTTTTY